MTTKPTIKDWSFSRLAIFEQCAYRAKLQSIDKIPDNTPKTAADRGTLIHTEAETYVKGDGPLPPSLAKFQTDFESLRRHYADGRVFLEGEWGFDSEWNRTSWATAWLRLKCDAVVALGNDTIAVIDYKGLALDTSIPTSKGWTTMGDIKVGDKVFDQNGDECTVIGKSQIKNLPCYEIVFDDTTRVTCDEEHLWTLNDGSVVPVTNLTKQSYINVCEPLGLPEKELPVHPYVLGIWLADGKHTSGEITKPDDFIWKEIKRCGYQISHDYAERAGKNKCRIHSVRNLTTQLKVINVYGNKHIPQMYMRASFEQRLALLQGLMDGDGSVNPLRKQVVLSTVDPDLAEQYRELICSLGQRCTVSPQLGKGFGKFCVFYPISFRPYGIIPFRLPRKAQLCMTFGPGRSATRRVKQVKRIESVPTQCILVDSLDHTFLCTKNFLPTHNTGARFGNEVKHLDQLHLYAVASFLRYTSVKKVITEDWYLDHNEKASHTMTDKQMPKHLAHFDKRGHTMTSTTVFKPNPNQFTCKWCPYGPDRQGDCKYGMSAKVAPPKKIVPIVNKPSATDALF